MPGKKPWDLTLTHSLEGAAEWIRKRSDALAVIVVRSRDYAFAVAPDLRPDEGYDAVLATLPGALDELRDRRQREKDAAVRKRAAEIAGRA